MSVTNPFGWRPDQLAELGRRTSPQSYMKDGPNQDRGERILKELAAMGFTVVPHRSFEDAWATKAKDGFMYGSDALEAVKLGFELAREP